MDKTKWRYNKLDNIVSILNGYAFKSNLYCNQGIRIIRITNVQDGYIEDSDPKFYPISYTKEISKFTLHENDLLISLTGNVGRVAFLPTQMLPAALNQRVACLRLKEGNAISLQFLYYFMRNKKFKDECIKSSKGVAQLNMSTEWLKLYNIPIPPITEQRAIATELDAVQKMIEGYKAQLTDFDMLAQSIFLDMFGDPIINIKGWRTEYFSNLFSLKSGDGLSAKQMESGPYPVYGGNGITGTHNKYNKDGEYILIGRVGAYCGNVRLVNDKFWLTDNAFELMCRIHKFNNIFLLYLLILLDLGQKAHKAAQPVISNIVLKNLIVPVPPLPLQQQFAERVEAIERQKELLQAQLAEAQTLMAERMQYYFD